MTAIESKIGVTVRLTLELIVPCVAEIVVEPTPIAVARPEALMAATAGFEDAHATVDVRF